MRHVLLGLVSILLFSYSSKKIHVIFLSYSDDSCSFHEPKRSLDNIAMKEVVCRSLSNNMNPPFSKFKDRIDKSSNSIRVIKLKNEKSFVSNSSHEFTVQIVTRERI